MAFWPAAPTLPVAVGECHPGTDRGLVGARVPVFGRPNPHPWYCPIALALAWLHPAFPRLQVKFQRVPLIVARLRPVPVTHLRRLVAPRLPRSARRGPLKALALCRFVAHFHFLPALNEEPSFPTGVPATSDEKAKKGEGVVSQDAWLSGRVGVFKKRKVERASRRVPSLPPGGRRAKAIPSFLGTFLLVPVPLESGGLSFY